MRRALRFFGIALFVSVPALVLAQNQVPDCVNVSAHAPYGSAGYNHVVRIENTCEREVRCQVATNVNPEAVSAVVGAGATREVVTFLGSPAREFTPRVSCELAR